MELPTVIHLQGDPSSKLTPLILIHAISGMALPYLGLGQLSPSNLSDGQGSRPVYGISSPIFESPYHRSPDSLLDLASQYITIVKDEIQAKGPYLLGGWSMGGMIAMEMAELLQAQGESVQHAILIDSLNPRVYPAFEDKQEHSQIAKITYNNIARRLNGTELDIDTEESDDEGYWTAESSDSESSQCSDSESDSEDDEGVDMMADMLPRLMQHIYQGLDLLGGAKKSKSAVQSNLRRTNVTLVRCKIPSKPAAHVRDRRKAFIRKMNADETLGWSSNKYQSLKVVDFSAQHDGCFDPSCVGELTQILRQVVASISI